MGRIPWGRISTGGIVVVIGVLLLLITTETVEADSFWAVIPAFFVILGLWALLRSGFRNLVGPVIVIAIAGAFLLESLRLIDPEVIRTWWPLFVVLFGALLVIDRLVGPHRSVTTDGSHPDGVTIVGTSDRRVHTDRFETADLVAIFGDTSLDLTGSAVDAPPATIDAVAIFGDVEVRVPAEWHVATDVAAVFGTVADRRPGRSSAVADEPDLVVTGVALFGDLVIRE